MNSILSFRSVRLAYPDSETTVLHNFSLNLQRGELLCLLGPSGCGKSTLLKAAAGLMPPKEGSIHSPPASAAMPYPRILVLQQDDQLFPWMTVEQNTGMPMKRRGKKEWKKTVHRILRSVSLGEAGHLYPHQLSGGMRQRAILARALTAEPELLMLDEPFAHLDASVRSALQNLVVEIWQKQEIMPSSLFFVTHDIQEALIMASRIIVLDQQGNIQTDRKIDLPRPRDPFNDRLIGMVRELRGLLD